MIFFRENFAEEFDGNESYGEENFEVFVGEEPSEEVQIFPPQLELDENYFIDDGYTTHPDSDDSYYSMDDSDNEEEIEIFNENEEINEAEEIRQWAVLNKIPLIHVTKLLKILRKRLIPGLPNTAETFLHTSSAEYNIETWENGEFVYLGLAEGLKLSVNPDLHDNVLELKFNIDGLPIYKSSPKQFWPILCQVHSENIKYKPFAVAIYNGDSKPDLESYMEKFVDELNLLLLNGVEIEDKFFEIEVKCFICDTPARAFIKNVQGHRGHFACERCDVKGFSFRNRSVFVGTDFTEKTDESFRNKECEGHHNGDTPLSDVNPRIDLVSKFVIDFMHLICLGIMKKLLLYWLTDKRYKMSNFSKTLLSQRLKNLIPEIPDEFTRKPRSVTYVSMWKATELRFFILYCGPIVLKNILKKEHYQHFLILHSACRILFDDELAVTKNEQAKNYLKVFVDTAPDYYDLDVLTLNTHNLSHLADDAKNMNCSLNHINAFPFESFLGELKNLLRSGNRPLAQVCRRLHEKKFLSSKLPTAPKRIVIKKSKFHANDQILHVKQIKFYQAFITCKKPDNIVLLKDKSCFKIDDMTFVNNQLKLIGRQIEIKKSLYNIPCNSKHLNQFEITDNISDKMEISINDVHRKMLKLSVMENDVKRNYVIPFLQ